jgi:hypothetical protein
MAALIRFKTLMVEAFLRYQEARMSEKGQYSTGMQDVLLPLNGCAGAVQ